MLGINLKFVIFAIFFAGYSETSPFDWKAKSQKQVRNVIFSIQMCQKTCILYPFCTKVRAPEAPIRTTVPFRIEVLG